MLTQRGFSGARNRALLVSMVSCVAVGVAVASGLTALAVTLVGLTILAGAVILNRARVSPVLWGGVAFTAPLQGLRVAPSVTACDVLIIAAVLTILPDAFARGRRRVLPAGVLVAFGVLVTAGVIGTFFAPDAGASAANLIRMVLAVVGSVLAMSLWGPDIVRLRQFARLWFAGASLSAAWAVLHPHAFGGRAIGLANHPNHFGLVCSLGVGLGLGIAMSSSGARARAAALAGVVLLTVGIGLSGSRAAIVGLVVTIGVTALLTGRFRLLVATAVTVVLASMAAVVGIFELPESNAISRLGGGGGSEASNIERTRTLTEALASIDRHPFSGQGFQFAQIAHNIYLQALVVGGPLALLGFLWVNGLIFRAGLRAAIAERGRLDGPVLAGLTAGYAGYLCSGLFSPILWDRYLWTYLGLLLVLSASTRPPPVGRWGPPSEVERGDHPGHSLQLPHEVL